MLGVVVVSQAAALIGAILAAIILGKQDSAPAEREKIEAGMLSRVSRRDAVGMTGQG